MTTQARRIFRLSFTPAIALVMAYALPVSLPFLAPLFAFFLASMPGSPLTIKKLLALIILMIMALGIGIVLIPLLLHFQISALLMVLIGLYYSAYLSVNLYKNLPGTFLAMGVTMISAAGTVNDALATMIIQALISAIIIATLCHSIVYLFFPDDLPMAKTENDAIEEQSEKSKSTTQSNWIAMRSTLIVFPAYLLLLTNPTLYMPIIMKALMLSQQTSSMDTKNAGRELISSTLLGGVLAILFWLALGLWANLWMFFLWMLLISLFVSSKIYQLIATRLPPSFWLNSIVTMLIMLGPAVEDSANGKDVYAAFFSRSVLLIFITIYALLAVYLLEYLKSRHRRRINAY